MAMRVGVRAVTLKMVATDAGVSVPTVCHVLRGRARMMRISVQSEQRIQEAARRLGYIGNYHAQALVTRATRAIGLTTSQGRSAFLGSIRWSQLVAGIEVQVRVHGYDLHLIGGGQVEDIPQLGYDQLMARRIDSLIMLPAIHLQLPKVLLQPKLPVVFIEPLAPPGCTSTGLDPLPGLEEAVLHLQALRHRCISWCSTTIDHPMIDQRRTHLRRVAQGLGLDFEEFIIPTSLPDTHQTEDTLNPLLECMQRQFRPSPRTTAIVCFNDAVALALMKVLKVQGVDVPEAVSVIGFDDLFAQFAIPALTTISHRFFDIGASAVDLAYALATGAAPKVPARVLLPSRLVVRSSTAPRRSGP